MLLAGTGGVSACSDSPAAPDSGVVTVEDAADPADSGPNAPDALEVPDVGEQPDAGPIADAGGMPPKDSGVATDSGPLTRGRRLVSFAEGIAEIVAVTADDSTLLFTQAGRLSAVGINIGSPVDLGPAPEALVPGPLTNTFWMFGDTTPSDPSSPRTVTVRVVSTETAAAMATDVAVGVLEDEMTVAPDGSRMIAATNLRTTGAAPNEVLMADLVVLSGNGASMMTLVTGFHVGAWDPMTTRFGGQCSTTVTFLEPSIAFVALCTEPAMGALDQRKLIKVDLDTGATTSLAEDVGSLGAMTTDKTAFLFVDNNGRMFGVDTLGAMAPVAVPMTEQSAVAQILPLDGARFAFVNAARLLRIAAWPQMTPTTLIGNVSEVLAVSPSKTDFLYSQMGVHTGTSDLWLTSTSSTPAPTIHLNNDTRGVPGNDAFSDDSLWVFWQSNFDPLQPQRTIVARKNIGARATLTMTGSLIRNYFDPSAVVLWTDGRLVGVGADRHLQVDVSVRKRSGQGPLTLVIPGTDGGNGSKPTYLLSPVSRNKYFYRIIDGPEALTGLYWKALIEAP